jgi:hypothetical protein
MCPKVINAKHFSVNLSGLFVGNISFVIFLGDRNKIIAFETAKRNRCSLDGLS